MQSSGDLADDRNFDGTPPPLPVEPDAATPPRSPQREARTRLRGFRPYVTYLLILANSAIFFGVALLWPGHESRVIEEYGHARVAVWEGEVWRLLTATFLHADWKHLGLNMFVLYMLGRVLECVLGRFRYSVIYLVSALSGSMFFQATSQTGVGIGASGAVYGLVGALLWIRFDSTGRVLYWAVLLAVLDQGFAWLLQQAQQGLNIATSAHLGGLVAGLLLGYPSLEVVRHPWRRRRTTARGRAFSVGLLSGVLVALTVYGCFFPVWDPIWPVFQGFKARRAGDDDRALALFKRAREVADTEESDQLFAYIVASELEEKRYDEAVSYWREHPGQHRQLQVDLGYELYDVLLAVGQREAAMSVLDDLIQATEDSLRRPGDVGVPGTQLHNEMAWFLAMRGERLDEALQHAKIAVAALELAEREDEGWLRALRGGHAALATTLNTQGWIEFLLGDTEEGLQHLTRAAQMLPQGAHFLYLAMAHFDVGNMKEALEAVRQAKDHGVALAHERKLLKDLLAQLGEL